MKKDLEHRGGLVILLKLVIWRGKHTRTHARAHTNTHTATHTQTHTHLGTGFTQAVIITFRRTVNKLKQLPCEHATEQSDV